MSNKINLEFDIEDILAEIPNKRIKETLGSDGVLDLYEDYEIKWEAEKRGYEVFDDPEDCLKKVPSNKIIAYVNQETPHSAFDINEAIEEQLSDQELVQEFHNRFLKIKGDKLKRALCDVFGLSYHASNESIVETINKDLNG